MITATLAALSFLFQSPAPKPAPPQAHTETRPIPDAWQVKIRSAQLDVMQKQEALDQAIKGCDECLVSQSNLNISTRALNKAAEDAARESHCMGRLNADLTCPMSVEVPPAPPPGKK
jgi:hypothetical protein